MTNQTTQCPKLDQCNKVAMVLGKEMEPDQYSYSVRRICQDCIRKGESQ